jgi:threonine aldolase
VLVGSREFIYEARRARKMVGGGMRQVGVLAAAGLIGIHTMSQRLQEDHDNAALLAEGLSEVPHLNVLSHATNFVFLQLASSSPTTAEEFKQKLQDDYNILVISYPGIPDKFRLVTHYWISQERVHQVIEACREILK